MGKYENNKHNNIEYEKVMESNNKQLQMKNRRKIYEKVI